MNGPPFRIREALSDADWAAVRHVREVVFVGEQVCPPDEEWDAYDVPAARGRTVHHLLGTVGGETAAVARWRPVETADGSEPGLPATGLPATGLPATGLPATGLPAAKLERFAVLVPFRGMGLGRQMVARALADARAAGHARFVLHAQTHLAGFYASFGFMPVGERFWEAGIEHVKMTLADSPPG